MPLNHSSKSLAIHNWLLHSASKASDRQGSSQGCNRDTKVLNSTGSTQQQPAVKDFPGLNRDPSEDVISRTFSMACQEPPSRRSPWESGLDDENLPQRLGLYAPFRSFGRQSNDMDVDQHSIQASARKRKRNLPSASSDIEPAMFQTHTKLKTSDCVRRRMTSASVDIAELKESVSGSNDGYSDVSTHSRRSSENIYRRKPRRKTREDRYDLKSVENPPKKPKNNHGRERDGKRRRKSGSAMMHEFFAENVAPTRLTFKSAPTLGLFSKGRASSPVKRKGLPDLAFSELSFLKSKRETPDGSIKDKTEKLRLKRGNDWDAGAHISRYFASRKSVDQSRCPETSKLSGRATLEPEYPSRVHTDRNVTPADSVNMSEKPCLGFGSSRGYLTSPARNIERKTNSQSPKPLSTRTASLVSWSVSGVPTHHDSIDRNIKKSSDDVPNVRTNIKTDHKASMTRQKPYDSVLPRRKVIHSREKFCNLDEQQEELSGFIAGNALSETMTTNRVGVLEPQANGREKRMFVKELAFSGQEDSPSQESQAQFDAAPENWPKNCKSTKYSPHGPVCSKATNTMFLPEKPVNIHNGSPTLVSQGNHNIQVSTIECGCKNSEALHNYFFDPRFVDPHLIPGALSFELRTDQQKEHLNFGLVDYHGRRIPQYAYTSDHYDEHSYHQQRNGCSNCTNRLAGVGNLEACTVAYSPGEFISHENGAIGDHRNYGFYGRNDSTQFPEELPNSYDEQKTESAIHETGEPPSRYTTKNETVLDAEARDDEPLFNENMDPGYYSVLEDNYEDLLDREINPAGLPLDKNRYLERPLQDEYLYDSFIPRKYIRRGAVNNVDIRQRMAMLQPNDELVIPGFWKPQKL